MLDPTPFAAQIAIVAIFWIIGSAMVGGLLAGILEIVLKVVDPKANHTKIVEVAGLTIFGWSLLSSLLYFFLHWTLR